MKTSHSIIAALAILAGPAVAQETADTMTTADPALVAEEDYSAIEIDLGSFESSELVGKRVYVGEEGSDLTAGLDNGWDDIGEVGDLVFNDDGTLAAVLIDVGGFLGIGEKVVATRLDDLSFYTETGGDENFFVVYKGSAEALENQEEWTEGSVVPAADTATNDGAMADDTMSDDTMAEDDMAMESDAEADVTAEPMTDQEVENADTAIDSTDEALESEPADGAMATEDGAAMDDEAMADETMTDDAMADDMASDDMAAEDNADMATEDDTIEADGELIVEDGAMDDEAMADDTMTDEAVATDDAMADDSMDAADANMWTAPTMEMEGYASVDAAMLTVEDLQGAPVFGIDEDRIGEVAEVVLSENGDIEYALIDVGGFLGLGEDRVQVAFDELQILRNDAGDDVRVYVDATEDQMEERADAYE
ncbi:PRC-barrel domain-containing protein [Pseudoroseicyclus sp. H15]